MMAVLWRTANQTHFVKKKEARPMKKFIVALVALALSPFAIAQNTFTYTAQSGVSLFTAQSATATATSGAARLPGFSGYGTLNITGAGIAGSPSGCTVALKYQGNNSGTATSAVATIAFTPGNTAQTFNVSPTTPTGDQYVATYFCATYPTAGAVTVSFSPATTVAVLNTDGAGDPCNNPSVPKLSVPLNITTATTTQLVALTASKSIYVCDAAATVGGSTTAQLSYGTGAACGTGTTVLTGVMTGLAPLGYGGTIASIPAGNALCLVSTGTGGIQGILTYVQQ